MLRLCTNKKAQTTAEYAILVAVIAATAIAMQTYLKRGLQGRFRDAVDNLQTQTSNIGTTGQFEPDYLESNFVSTRNVETREQELTGGAVRRDFTVERIDRSGFQKFLAPANSEQPQPQP